MGRPTKLTPELQTRIVTFLGAGAYIETAAEAAGLSKQTLYTWLRRGAEGKRPFAKFLDAVQKAQAEADLRDLKTIRTAADTNGVWQAAAWRLERRHPEQWGRRVVEVTGKDGGPIQHEDVTDAPLQDLVAEATALCERAAAAGGSERGDRPAAD